jgi:probable rRNA maturation factor
MDTGPLNIPVPRTMIFLDPDLESDRSKPAKLRSAIPSPRAIPRSHRIPSVHALGRFLHDAQSAVKLRGEVTVLLTTDTAIRRLNRQFRGKNKATDVLSFPAYSPAPKSKGPEPAAKSSLVSGSRPGPPRVVGDIAISVHTARKQADALGHALAVEIKVLMLHGLLHLAGLDHETDDGEMARREGRLRAKLRLPQGLIERSVRA